MLRNVHLLLVWLLGPYDSLRLLPLWLLPSCCRQCCCRLLSRIRTDVFGCAELLQQLLPYRLVTRALHEVPVAHNSPVVSARHGEPGQLLQLCQLQHVQCCVA